MSDTLITVIAIALAAVLMFVFPLMTMSDRTDDVSQLTVETATTEFVDDVRTTGKITEAKYNKFTESIGATGNTYNSPITHLSNRVLKNVQIPLIHGRECDHTAWSVTML